MFLLDFLEGDGIIGEVTEERFTFGVFVMLATKWNVAVEHNHNENAYKLSIFMIDETKKFGEEGFIIRHEADGKMFESNDEGFEYAKSIGLVKD
jgi:hypothetical protein